MNAWIILRHVRTMQDVVTPKGVLHVPVSKVLQEMELTAEVRKHFDLLY